MLRALAYREAKAPAASRGTFIGIGAAFDALKAVGKLLAEAKRDVLIVDPYMDSKVLTDFALQASPGVAVRLRVRLSNTCVNLGDWKGSLVCDDYSAYEAGLPVAA